MVQTAEKKQFELHHVIHGSQNIKRTGVAIQDTTPCRKKAKDEEKDKNM